MIARLPLLRYYRVFRGYGGRRLPLAIGMMLLAGLLEGVGIGMFVPLLNTGVAGRMGDDAVSAWVTRMFASVGIEATFVGLLVLIVVVFILKGVATLALTALSAAISAGLTRDLRQKLVDLVEVTSYRNYLQVHTGFLTNVVSVETDRAVSSFGHYATTVASLIYVGVYTAICFVIDWQAAAATTLLAVLLILSLSSLHGISREHSRTVSRVNARLQELIIQAIRSFKYLSSTESFAPLSRKLHSEIGTLAHHVYKLAFMGGGLKASVEPLGVVVVAILLYIDVAILGRPLASMLAVAFLFYRMMVKVMTAQNYWQLFNGTIGGLEMYQHAFELLQRDIAPKGSRAIERFDDAIILRGVSVYHGDRKVLRDVDLRIPAYSSVAIVGKTGAGKSTVVSLLTGLLAADEGTVEIDGIDYAELDETSLRRRIGYVTQEPVVFADTIANNISLWEREDGDDQCRARVEAAGRAAHADGFVADLPAGYDTVVGDEGKTLSGGQRQQICIARELFKDPELLILDEAMSSLDPRSEWLIGQALDQLKGTRTIVMVTHRLASARNCDYVYVLSDGRVSEEGTFEELSTRADSKFSELALLQQI